MKPVRSHDHMHDDVTDAPPKDESETGDEIGATSSPLRWMPTKELYMVYIVKIKIAARPTHLLK